MSPFRARVLAAVTAEPREASDVCDDIRRRSGGASTGWLLVAVIKELCALADAGAIVREDSGQGPATYRTA